MLPNQFSIDIPSAKLAGYPLNAQHPDGWSKARFFRQHGMATEEALRAVLMAIIASNEPSQSMATPFGQKYIVDGLLANNSAVFIRTVWIALKDENICRSVTAYPL